MNLKLLALSYTAGIFLCIGVGSVCLVQILNMISPEYYSSIFVAAGIGMCFYFVYSVCVAQLEYRAKLEEITKK